MKRVNLLPNLITAFGLACGLFVIFRTYTLPEQTPIYQLLFTSMLLILLAALADVLDGAVARILKHESEFGALFDSLSDAVSFGVAPSVLMLKALAPEHGTPLSFFCVVAAIAYSICGVLRLVRYNVKANIAKKNESTLRDYNKNFSGLPIPAAAGAALAVNFFLVSPRATDWFAPSAVMRSWILIAAMIAIGLLMISRVRFPSLKTLHCRVPSSYLVFFTALGAMLVLYGILHAFSLFLLIVTWSYILVGCALTITRLIAGKRSKKLEDFEPTDDE
ncbi:MAG: CDP-alcohol phosphatidyltransferase family protein [Chlamydiia bacterium]|nr:CDP-alcohol phosphatidyltransferase family protein [Chlamydiia bacterium]